MDSTTTDHSPTTGHGSSAHRVPSEPTAPPPASDPFTIRLGRDAALSVALPVLAGDREENLFPDATRHNERCGFELFQAGPWLLGFTSRPARAELERATRQLYTDLLTVAQGRHLTRIWNYVPAINAHGLDGLENYRAFSRGRSVAFETASGPTFKRWLPSASAVGSRDDQLAVLFAAHTAMPRHRENPEQVPAYEYPDEHGPRSPSFARASEVTHDNGRRDVFISGTSAIKGHSTIAPGDTAAQTVCTLENLRTIGAICGLGSACGADAASRHVKVYLRDAREQSMVQRLLEMDFLRPKDVVTYLAADICRAALNVEIEVTVFGATA